MNWLFLFIGLPNEYSIRLFGISPKIQTWRRTTGYMWSSLTQVALGDQWDLDPSNPPPLVVQPYKDNGGQFGEEITYSILISIW